MRANPYPRFDGFTTKGQEGPSLYLKTVKEEET
jgi:hypothetical protein